MSAPSKPESEISAEIPLLTREETIKALLQLSGDDLKTLMKLWIMTSLQSKAKKKSLTVTKEDIEYHAQCLDKDLKKLPKRSCVVKWLKEYLDSKLNPVQQAQLELSSVLRRPKKIRWTVHHLIKSTEEDTDTQNAGVSHKRLEVALSKSLSIYFPNIVYVARNEGKFWVRVAIYPGPEYVKYPKVYLVYRPLTKFIVMSPVSATVRSYLNQALCEVLSFDTIEHIPLTGSSPLGLLDLILLRQSQGAFSRYRLGQVEAEPLQQNNQLTVPPNKKGAFKRSFSGVVDEEKSVKGRKKFSALQEFGPNLQPELDKLQLKFKLDNESPDRGVSINSNSSTVSIPFEMTVRFEGANILEGLKLLSSNNKLPSYLSQVHSKGANCLEVEQLDYSI